MSLKRRRRRRQQVVRGRPAALKLSSGGFAGEATVVVVVVATTQRSAHKQSAKWLDRSPGQRNLSFRRVKWAACLQSAAFRSFSFPFRSGRLAFARQVVRLFSRLFKLPQAARAISALGEARFCAEASAIWPAYVQLADKTQTQPQPSYLRRDAALHGRPSAGPAKRPSLAR